MGRSDFGLAYDPGTDKLYALGGDAQGGGFFDSVTEVDEPPPLQLGQPVAWIASPPDLPTPARSANQAGFYGNGAIWSVGGINGQTFQFLSDAYYRPNVCGPTALNAVSRVNHGGCGTFDIPMPLTCPWSGRPQHRWQLHASGHLQFGYHRPGTASVTCHNPGTGTGTAGAATRAGTRSLSR